MLAGPVVMKRAILTVSQLIPISQPTLLDDLPGNIILPNLTPGAPVEKQRNTVQLVTIVARHSLGQISPALDRAL